MALDYLDVPVESAHEAALRMMVDEGVFTEIETANQNNLDKADGRMSEEDWAAILEGDFGAEATAIAQFLHDNPEEWAKLDTARDGMFLTELADGTYAVGEGDGITSWADVQQYRANLARFNALSMNVNGTDAVLKDLDGDGRLDEDEFQAALEALEESHPQYEGLRDALQYSLDEDLMNLPDDRSTWQKIGDGLYTISSLNPTSPTFFYRLATEPGELASDHWSFTKGAGNAVVGIGLFVYDISTISPGAPGFWLETWRVDGDMSQHRGMQLVQAVPHLANAAASLVPGTPQFDQALAEVRRQGTWDAHQGLNLATTVIDWEGFVEDPAAWAGQFAPDVLITVLTGGGGAITRVGSTGSRIATASRNFLSSVSRNGLRTTLGTSFRNTTTRIGTRWSTRFGRSVDGVDPATLPDQQTLFDHNVGRPGQQTLFDLGPASKVDDIAPDGPPPLHPGQTRLDLDPPAPADEVFQPTLLDNVSADPPAVAKLPEYPDARPITIDGRGRHAGNTNAGTDAPRFSRWLADTDTVVGYSAKGEPIYGVGGTVRYDAATDTYIYGARVRQANGTERWIEVAYRLDPTTGTRHPDFAPYADEVVQIDNMRGLPEYKSGQQEDFSQAWKSLETQLTESGYSLPEARA